MKFRALEVRAFNRVRSPFTVPLDMPGLILVQGVNRDYGPSAISGEASNGAGKSWVWEAFLWALYGKMARHGNKAITSEAIHPKRGADVIVDVEIGGYTFSVNRVRPTKGKSTFEIRHVDGTFPLSRDVSQRTEDAAELFGFDYQACRSSIILQGDGAGLAKAEFAVQMSVLEAILRMEELSKAAEVAKEANRAVEVLLATRVGELGVREYAMAQDQAALESLMDVSPDEEELSAMQAEIIDLQALAAEVPKLEKAHGKSTEALEKARSQLTQKSETLATIRAKLEETRKSLTRSVCPTCQRPLKDQEEVATLRKAETDLQFDWHKRQQELDKYRAAQQGATDVHATTLAVLQNAQRAQGRTQDLEAHYQSLLAVQGDYQARLAAAQAKLEASRLLAESSLVAVQALRTQQAQAAFWVKGFGRDGLQAQIFQAAVPVLNTSAERYAQALSGGQLGVTFNPSRGTRLEDLIRVSGASAPTYDGLSRGEKQRVNLIVAWSLRELARWRLPEPINLAVYDETFDGFDDAGLGVVVELLQNEVAQGMTVFVVSHNATMKRMFPGARVMTVTREHGEASITWTS